MFPNKVTGQQDGSVVDPSMGAAGEVPAQGMPTTPTGDANGGDPIAEFQKRLEQAEEDRRKQQSIYDRKLAEAERERQQLLQRLDDAQRKTMSAEELKDYEATQYKEKYEALLRQQEEERARRDYMTAFAQTFDVPVEELEKAQTADELVNIGWQLAARRYAEAKEKANSNPAQHSTNQTPRNQTPVITGSGVAPRTAPTEAEFRKSLAERVGKQYLTDDEYWSIIERNPRIMDQWLQERNSQ